MAIADRGACEWFVWDIRRSNLIDRGQIDQVVDEFFKKQPNAEPPALAQYLVSQGILTQFQAERLLEGKTQGLVQGPYTVVDVLGSGSMGTVYKAKSKNDHEFFAVKVLPRRSMWNVRIARRQIRIFEQCQHPAVVPFTDVGTSGGMHYLAWPLVEGESLDHLIERQGKLPPPLAARYALQTAEGLEACHQKGLFHGLLKPSNLMVGPDQQVRILDFGIGGLLAEAREESLVDTMSTANTLTSGLDCASPESILEPTNRTPAGDQYSLGCILYFCLTGRYPFAEDNAVQKMMAHQSKQPPPIWKFSPEVPEALVAIVERLMQKNAADRYDTISDTVKELTPFANAPSPTARAVGRAIHVPGRGAEVPSPRAPEVTPDTYIAARNAARNAARVMPPPTLPTRESMNGSPADVPPPPPETVPPGLPAPLMSRELLASLRAQGERFGSFGLTCAALLIGVLLWFGWRLLHH